MRPSDHFGFVNEGVCANGSCALHFSPLVDAGAVFVAVGDSLRLDFEYEWTAPNVAAPIASRANFPADAGGGASSKTAVMKMSRALEMNEAWCATAAEWATAEWWFVI